MEMVPEERQIDEVRLYKGPMHGQTVTKQDPPKTIEFEIDDYLYRYVLRKSQQGMIGYVFAANYGSLKSGRRGNGSPIKERNDQ